MKERLIPWVSTAFARDMEFAVDVQTATEAWFFPAIQ